MTSRAWIKQWVILIVVSLGCVSFAVAQSPPVPPPASVPCVSASLSVSGSSSNIILPNTTPVCQVITLTNNGTSDVFYALGGSSVVATTASFPLLAGYSVSFWTKATYIAAITATGSSTLRIVQANGPMLQAHKFGTSPPSCSNVLDFTQSCNSQYFAMGGLL